MLRTALAALLALASVWEGPVTLPSDDHFNDTFQLRRGPLHAHLDFGFLQLGNVLQRAQPTCAHAHAVEHH